MESMRAKEMASRPNDLTKESLYLFMTYHTPRAGSTATTIAESLKQSKDAVEGCLKLLSSQQLGEEFLVLSVERGGVTVWSVFM